MYRLPGDTRYLLQSVEDLKVEVIQHYGKDIDLIDPLVPISESAVKFKDEEPSSETTEKHRSVLLQFKLKKGSYATMAFREFMHFTSDLESQLQHNSEN